MSYEVWMEICAKEYHSGSLRSDFFAIDCSSPKGGTIYASSNNSYLFLRHSKFENCNGGRGSGGAVVIADNNNYAVLQDIKAIGCSATTGGAVSIETNNNDRLCDIK